ncbi:methyltransferase domain-containing protein [Candidatus Woesearchaeota archaeon]|nr:MAG: methyltransferase domain-containing protein [Candidatus Woesearchaeota archaeon]
MSKLMKLNFGCGTDIKKGYLNVDHIKLKGVDKVMDLNVFPYPFASNSCDEILMDHVLDHLDKPTRVLQELHRIIKKSGKIVIKVPHFSCGMAYWGDVRKSLYSYYAFKRYETGQKRSYYFPFSFRNVQVYFDFQKKPFLVFFYNHIIAWIANAKPYLYENTFLRVFPCRTLVATLRK